MPKVKRAIWTFQFEALPHNMIEARRIARFLKEALRFYGLKLITMKREPEEFDQPPPPSPVEKTPREVIQRAIKNCNERTSHNENQVRPAKT